MRKSKKPALPLAETVLQRHFGKLRLHQLVTASRSFPVTARVDLQAALERMFETDQTADLVGIHTQFSHETLTVAHLLSNPHSPVVIAPLQHEEVDIGETVPARCLKQALWLSSSQGAPFALLLSPAQRYAQSEGVHVEVAVAPGEAGDRLSRRVLEEIENQVKQSRSYRGKVISLEASDRYSGHTGVIRVHKLRTVKAEEVILPHKTLELLNRNIAEFVKNREQLRSLGMPVKKGVLFYGPPGTGKTHTIHYLASQLPDHTTLLVTAEQVGLLDHYFQLARFLQPSMIVIEDVDLIARTREEMHGPCEESMLNKLLNEMDGLREDAAVLFVLTTNRPEHLEAALSSRPGRVDQAIEFPLPDDRGRKQLVHLYACGLNLSTTLVELIVRKTEHASAAFIKELMRRCAQYHIQNSRKGALAIEDVDAALEEMLFSGGTLNAKLLGAAGVTRGMVN
jgi:AAA+ superfamily predicted ATPase